MLKDWATPRKKEKKKQKQKTIKKATQKKIKAIPY